MKSSDTVFIINPASSKGANLLKWDRLKRPLQEKLNLEKINEHFTTSEDYGRGYVKEVIQSGVKNIIVFGGDGTLSEVVQGIYENDKLIANDISLGLIPAGRGNDFYRSVSKEIKNTQAKSPVDIISLGNKKKIDIARITYYKDGNIINNNKNYFINIASFGYSGLLVQKVHSENKSTIMNALTKTSFSYLAQTLPTMSEYQAVAADVYVDGQECYSGNVYLGLILNGMYNAGGICWSRSTKLDDGKFDFVLFKDLGTLKNLKTMSMALINGWNEHSNYIYKRASNIKIKFNPENQKKHPYFEIDGDQDENEIADMFELSLLPSQVDFFWS